MRDRTDKPSGLLPTDPFELALAASIGLPNGAHTDPVVVQAIDFYGNSSAYIVQTVRTDKGTAHFVQIVGATKTVRFVIPPEVIKVQDRQRESVTAQLRRRHGQRLAEAASSSRPAGGFTPEMRQKALATRRAKAARKAARRARKAVRS